MMNVFMYVEGRVRCASSTDYKMSDRAGEKGKKEKKNVPK